MSQPVRFPRHLPLALHLALRLAGDARAVERGAQAPALAAHLGRAGRGRAGRRAGDRRAGRRPARSRRRRSTCARAQEIEAEIHHDLMAEVRTYAEQCPVGGGIIHLGATTMDIEDNADALRLRGSLDLVLDTLRRLLLAFADQIERLGRLRRPWPSPTCSPPSRPPTGYRLAQYAQDLLGRLRRAAPRCATASAARGSRARSGTSASYAQLLEAEVRRGRGET